MPKAEFRPGPGGHRFENDGSFDPTDAKPWLLRYKAIATIALLTLAGGTALSLLEVHAHEQFVTILIGLTLVVSLAILAAAITAAVYAKPAAEQLLKRPQFEVWFAESEVDGRLRIAPSWTGAARLSEPFELRIVTKNTGRASAHNVIWNYDLPPFLPPLGAFSAPDVGKPYVKDGVYHAKTEMLSDDTLRFVRALDDVVLHPHVNSTACLPVCVPLVDEFDLTVRIVALDVPIFEQTLVVEVEHPPTTVSIAPEASTQAEPSNISPDIPPRIDPIETLAKLEQAGALLNAGLLTQEEFDALKAELVGRKAVSR